MEKYLIAIGAVQHSQGGVVIAVNAPSAQDAIWILKRMIDRRRHQPFNELISMSLVESYDGAGLNYVVMPADRSSLLCGECEGTFESPVSHRLAKSLEYVIPIGLVYEAARQA
ncbi:MAG TPA: hypothetical protein V6C81_21730 [Planktothrix sp.]|jgi:cAMP phosphodiesterase